MKTSQNAPTVDLGWSFPTQTQRLAQLAFSESQLELESVDVWNVDDSGLGSDVHAPTVTLAPFATIVPHTPTLPVNSSHQDTRVWNGQDGGGSITFSVQSDC